MLELNPTPNCMGTTSYLGIHKIPLSLHETLNEDIAPDAHAAELAVAAVEVALRAAVCTSTVAFGFALYAALKRSGLTVCVP